jgi:hypothetical protein
MIELISGAKRTVKQPVAFQNSPDVTFVASLAYLGAIAILSLGILLLCLGYPEWTTIGGLFLASLSCAVLSHRYLSRCFGSLHIGPLGMEYFPVAGEKTSFRWRELAHIKVLPGWLRIYDKQGNKVLSYTYGLGKQHTLINVIARQMGKRKMRPVIWPEVVNSPAAKRAGRTGGNVAIRKSVPQRKKKSLAKVTCVPGTHSLVTKTDNRQRSRARKGTATKADPRADHNSLQHQP